MEGAWRRGRSSSGTRYERLPADEAREGFGRRRKGMVVPKGYVPVLVGTSTAGEEEMKRFLLHVRLLKDPCIGALLEMAAEEFGFRQDGVLRIPCGVEHFRQTVDGICRAW
ncbi:Auxin-induced protein X10A [Apostasia shenzhenica]|uniref:Auxin-induced protein X10A n=1 Tax=Apostasia shenzhenica TaxID=1088818 RepID=A0A2I0AN96_9ASPA|nr:Auxin-induced protein X10A [Apostasia shenzhenica]